MKTLALFTPYELIAGGGTRYLLGLAEAFRDVYQVYLITPSALPLPAIVKAARSVGVCADHVIPLSWEDAHRRAQNASFSYAVAVGNEPLPEVPGLADHNFFHCQFPFPMLGDDLKMKLIYLSQCEGIVVNSEYTRRHLRARLEELGAPSPPIHVIYPAADPIPPDNSFIKREPGTIVSVGRFFDVGSKRQDELIRAFRKIAGDGWVLHLAGAVYQGQTRYAMYDNCVRLAQDLPVRFHPNASRAAIARLYLQSTWYWHGAGLGADPATEPEKFEHFGIAVVEAMAAGCLPLVLGQGGPAEIVTPGSDGWTFETVDELAELTLKLATLPDSQLDEMRARARKRASAFTFNVFEAKWRALLS